MPDMRTSVPTLTPSTRLNLASTSYPDTGPEPVLVYANNRKNPATAITAAPIRVSTIEFCIRASTRAPRFVVAGGGRALALRPQTAIGMVRSLSPGQVRLVRSFPNLAWQWGNCWWLVEGMMQPAVPFGGHARCFDGACIDHPAALPVFGLIIA